MTDLSPTAQATLRKVVETLYADSPQFELHYAMLEVSLRGMLRVVAVLETGDALAAVRELARSGEMLAQAQADAVKAAGWPLVSLVKPEPH